MPGLSRRGAAVASAGPARQSVRMTDDSLKGALALQSPEACLAYYRDWAASYDSGFARGMDYLLPAHVAADWRKRGLHLADRQVAAVEIGPLPFEQRHEVEVLPELVGGDRIGGPQPLMEQQITGDHH